MMGGRANETERPEMQDETAETRRDEENDLSKTPSREEEKRKRELTSLEPV